MKAMACLGVLMALSATTLALAQRLPDAAPVPETRDGLPEAAAPSDAVPVPRPEPRPNADEAPAARDDAAPGDTPSAAPPPAVFAQVNDLRQWEAWSPWAKLDPAVKNTFEGAATGTGAIFRWAGNNEVGEGRMTITESRPSDLIRMKLEFLKPFAAISTTPDSFSSTRLTAGMVITRASLRAGIAALIERGSAVPRVRGTASAR